MDKFKSMLGATTPSKPKHEYKSLLVQEMMENSESKRQERADRRASEKAIRISEDPVWAELEAEKWGTLYISFDRDVSRRGRKHES